MSRHGPEHVTERQRRCWEALHQYRSIRGAADALGLSPFSVRDSCESYQRHMGIEGPLPFVKLYRSRSESQALTAALARISELERELAKRDREIERLEGAMSLLEEQAAPWREVHRKLDALLARPVGAIVPTHRRIADGGVGGVRERRGERVVA